MFSTLILSQRQGGQMCKGTLKVRHFYNYRFRKRCVQISDLRLNVERLIVQASLTEH